MLTTVLIVVVVLVALLAASGVRMVQQYQRGVVLRFGRLLPEVREPGLRLMIPMADRMVKVPVQTIVLDVPPQGAITKDNVTLSVDAVVYFRVDRSGQGGGECRELRGRHLPGRTDLPAVGDRPCRPGHDVVRPRAGQFRAARGDRHPDR